MQPENDAPDARSRQPVPVQTTRAVNAVQKPPPVFTSVEDSLPTPSKLKTSFEPSCFFSGTADAAAVEAAAEDSGADVTASGGSVSAGALPVQQASGRRRAAARTKVSRREKTGFFIADRTSGRVSV